MVRASDSQIIRRRKLRNRRIVIVFFAFLGVVVFLESPLTRVRGFVVQGNRSISANQILQDTSLHTGMSLWQVNGQAVADEVLSKEPLVEKVQVTTNNVQGIVHIDVTEKHIVAVYAVDGKFYNLLNDGVVYSMNLNQGGFSWPLVTVSGNPVPTLGKTLTSAVHTLCNQLSGSTIQTGHISELHVDSFGYVTAYMDNGFAVLSPVHNLAVVLSSATNAIHYFLGKGYPPGLIDMSGLPPYRYTPFAKTPAKKGG